MMSNIQSVTSEWPKKPPTRQQEQFDSLYTTHSHRLKNFARQRRLPTEDIPDVLSDVWGIRVWRAVGKGKFQGRSEKDQSGLLFKILRGAICDHYRNRPKIMQLIAASLDDETAAASIESSLDKQQDDLTRPVILRELRKFLVAIGEQCLTNEKQRVIFYRYLEGETKPPEGWDSKDYSNNKYRMLAKLRRAIEKVLGKA